MKLVEVHVCDAATTNSELHRTGRQRPTARVWTGYTAEARSRGRRLGPTSSSTATTRRAPVGRTVRASLPGRMVGTVPSRSEPHRRNEAACGGRAANDASWRPCHRVSQDGDGMPLRRRAALVSACHKERAFEVVQTTLRRSARPGANATAGARLGTHLSRPQERRQIAPGSATQPHGQFFSIGRAQTGDTRQPGAPVHCGVSRETSAASHPSGSGTT